MHFWWVLLACVSAVYVGWPMNEQLPNVARVDESYLFTLANTTYKSSAGGAIAYSVAGLPAWLLFDPLSRTFLGTPSLADVQTFDITLVGTDSADRSNYSASYSMLVSNSSGLALSSPDVMFTEIAQYGYTNGVDGLVVAQGEDFSLQFSESVFQLNEDASQPVVAYYGRSEDRTSLPNWVSFDAASLTFSGQVPYVVSDIAPSLEYAFSFIASDYRGYAGAEGVFKLVVGAHLLSTSLNESIKINGTYGSAFAYTVPVLSAVYLDDALISKDNISAVAASGMPAYVLFDEDTYTLSGTFPNASLVQNFSVVVQDVYGDSVLLPYLFDSLDSVFTVDSIADVNATRGEYFLYQLLRSYFTDFDATAIDVSFANGSSWLAYDSSNLTIHGEAPADFARVQVTVDAASDFGDGLRSFDVVGVAGFSSTSLALSSSSSLSSSATSSSATATTTTSPSSSALASSDGSLSSSSKSSDAHKKLVLGLAIGLPLLALLAALLVFFFCCFRRRKSHDDENQSATDGKPEITGPGFGRINSNDDHEETAVQMGALNALKLDNDNLSMLSSVTHVDSDDDFFADAHEKPIMSWRANEASDSNAMKKKILQDKHASEMSLSTIATEQLFSVRLVDDSASNRNSSLSLGFFNRKSADLEGAMRDVSSGNIQRLDSDGNVTGSVSDHVSPSNPNPAGTQNGLNYILEEESHHMARTPESSDYNLLAKFLGLQTGSLGSSFNTSNDPHSPQPSTGDVEQNMSTSLDGTLLPSPDTESFLEDNPRQRSSPYSNANILARTSVYSELSLRESDADTALEGSKAKLVNFTRKASLRDSSRQQDVDHPAGKAQIFEDSD
ncbi:hypothetical protein METBIDRAFT_11952 [Metschnikowia bicuspidata var. bicuspidata NRRL YB-4993]|uniref:Dystroglycan-type cadherin-like domain-containing protein n=1 Tax=Metschnikowia bicuspidata var. bicuspidata NRRL YB-4993 TaxID=869754 RepID=A0A1A0HBP7_9ASCO|nr:hypothetical protein METBIDRAFT_11952 [Metschnikowia bicuspidata var. bicuspidata NRRL YB-4993]OBA21436.1 hypothetical protein METBIDRAFT_11952 [Metschnikowia bicuspidata var. bicuspidata NRRL YB-4993]